MNDITFDACQRCCSRMEEGFFTRSVLSLVEAKKFENYVFADEDLMKTSLWQKFFRSKALNCRAFLCHSCKAYTIDFSTVLDRKQANEAAWAIRLQI